MNRNQVFGTMFWHEKTYSHRVKALAHGWSCLDCHAKMDAPDEPGKAGEAKP